MSRVLAYTSPARGHLFPLVPILDELVRRGHEVHLRTLAGEIPGMRARAFAAEPIDARIEAVPLEDWKAPNARSALVAATATFVARGAFDGPDLAAACAAVDPDVLVVDVNAWGASAAAEASGRPWAAFSPYLLPIASPDAPPYGLGLTPARGPLGRIRDAVVRPLVIGMVERTMLPRYNAVRRAISPALTPIRSATDMYGRAPRLLYLTAEPFEYHRRAWPTNVRMIGPSAWEPTSEAPAWLADEKRPVILVATSSEYQADARLAQAAFDAFANEDVLVVATLPSQDPTALRVPANGRAESFVPHGPILARAALAITHGGMGVTQKALAAGVPVVAVPFGRDQPETARRVEVAGAGVMLAPRRMSPASLRAAAAVARGRKAGAERIAAAFAAAGGAPRAAAELEGLIAGG